MSRFFSAIKLAFTIIAVISFVSALSIMVLLQGETTYLGTDLPSMLVSGDGRRTIVDGQPGYLTFGPYVQIAEGSYRIEVYYSCDSEGNYFDVCGDTGRAVYAKQDLSAQQKLSHVELELPDEERLEIRTYYSGAGSMTVDKIVVQAVHSVLVPTVLLTVGLVSGAIAVILMLCDSKAAGKKVAGEKEKLSVQKKVRNALAPALLLAFILCVLGPVDLYTANCGELWFSFWQLLPIIVVSFALFFAAAVIVPVLCGGCLHVILLAVEVGLGTGLYLQGNYLKNNFGELNGTQIIWSQYYEQGVLSVIVWCVCILLPVLLVLLIDQHKPVFLKWWPAAVTAVGALSAAMLLITAPKLSGNLDYYFSTEGMFDISENENIIVFVLDTIDRRFFDEILEKYPEYSENFCDFTYFPDTVCGGATTSYAIPYILTGQQCFDGHEYVQYVGKAYGRNISFYNALKSNNFDIGIYTATGYVSGEFAEMFCSNVGVDKLSVNSYPGLTITMYKLVLLKYAPQPLKQMFWLSSDEFENYAEIIGNNGVSNYSLTDDAMIDFYKRISNYGLDINESQNIFRFIHLIGAHPPYTFDENLNDIGKSSALKECCGSLMIAIKYIEQLKKNGLYDNTTIIVMSDHGHGTYAFENPLFMIKVADEKHPDMITNYAPIAYSEFIPTIASLFLEDYSNYGKSVFDIDEYSKRMRLHVASAPITEQYCGDIPSSQIGAFEITGVAGTGEGITYMGDAAKYYKQHEELWAE